MATINDVVLEEGKTFTDNEQQYQICKVYNRPIHNLAEYLGDGTAIARISGDCWEPSLTGFQWFIGGIGSVERRTIMRCRGEDGDDPCVAKITFKIENIAPIIGGVPAPGGGSVPCLIPQMRLNTATVIFPCSPRIPSGGLIFDSTNKVGLFIPEGAQSPDIELGKETAAGLWL